MSMNRTLSFGLLAALPLAFAACGSNTSTDDAGFTMGPDTAVTTIPDAAVTTTPDAAVGGDTGSTVADPYVWVVIQDTEQKACTTNGPGTDVDAVAKLDPKTGLPIAWGMKGTAKFTPNPGGYACDNADCSGGNCKYAYNSLTLAPAQLVARTEGLADANVKAVGDDDGYFSLNAGTLQIELADATTGVQVPIKSGDWIYIYEVDQTYVTSKAAPATCTCLPERYTVSLQTATGKTLALTPVTISDDNSDTCSALTANSKEGCGSTEFAVP